MSGFIAVKSSSDDDLSQAVCPKVVQVGPEFSSASSPPSKGSAWAWFSGLPPGAEGVVSLLPSSEGIDAGRISSRNHKRHLKKERKENVAIFAYPDAVLST